MFRTSLGILVALVTTSALAGCTITTYDNPNTGSSSSSYNRPRHTSHTGKAAPAKKPSGSQPSGTVPVQPVPSQPAGDPNANRNPVGVPDAVPRVTSKFAFGDGDGGAFRGLAYSLPQNTSRMPSLSGMKPFAEMFLDEFNVTPRDFGGGFPGVSRQSEWFAIKYEGTFSVPEQGKYNIRVVSDDGAIVYIDDNKIVDNDGVHASQSATSEASLRGGMHRLRVEYFHATGSVSLMLFIAHNGIENQLVATNRWR